MRYHEFSGVGGEIVSLHKIVVVFLRPFDFTVLLCVKFAWPYLSLGVPEFRIV